MSFNFLAAVTFCSDFGVQENKVCHCFHCFPFICHEVMGPAVMIFIFWMLNFKQLFHSPLSLSSRGSLVPLCFLPQGWCHLHICSCLIFLLAILIPACASSSPAFHMMYSAYKLNKQSDNIQPWHTLFPIWNKLFFHAWFCCILTCKYRFLRKQVRWSDIPISLKIFHSLLWSPQLKALV